MANLALVFENIVTGDVWDTDQLISIFGLEKGEILFIESIIISHSAVSLFIMEYDLEQPDTGDTDVDPGRNRIFLRVLEDDMKQVFLNLEIINRITWIQATTGTDITILYQKRKGSMDWRREVSEVVGDIKAVDSQITPGSEFYQAGDRKKVNF